MVIYTFQRSNQCKKMSDILKKLQGGDLRSIGRSNEVALEVEENTSLLGELFNGLDDDDPVIRMRSADVIEKVTQKNPELLSGFKAKIISVLTSARQQEVCWHMAQIAPRLTYDVEEEEIIIASLKTYLTHKSRIVVVSAMESLVAFAEKNSSLLNEVEGFIKKQIRTGSPAVKSRGRKLLPRIEKRI